MITSFDESVGNKVRRNERSYKRRVIKDETRKTWCKNWLSVTCLKIPPFSLRIRVFFSGTRNRGTRVMFSPGILIRVDLCHF